MTEYDYSPGALDAYNRTQQRIARWAEDTSAQAHQYKNPFGPRSEAGDSDDILYDRPPLPHRRSSSMGPPGVYNPVPAPNYPPQPYSGANIPGPLPGPMPAAQHGVQYSPYVVSPPAVMSSQHGSLYRSQSQDTISHNSHRRHKSHRSSRHHSKSPAYIIQTSPTYGPMMSPPLSTASGGSNVWYPQMAQPYATHPQATTPPQVLSPPHTPYVYPYSTAAPAGMQYPYGYAQQQQVQPQPQYIVVQGSKSRKSSKSRKYYHPTDTNSTISRSQASTPRARSRSPDHHDSHPPMSLLNRLLGGLHLGNNAASSDRDSNRKHRRSSSVLPPHVSAQYFSREYPPDGDFDVDLTRGRKSSRRDKDGRRARSGS